MERYRIVRFFQDNRERKLIKTNVTLEEAKDHCRLKITEGEGWFDGFEKYHDNRGGKREHKTEGVGAKGE